MPGVEREDLTGDPLELAVPAAWEQATTIASLADRPFAMEPLGTTSRTWSTTLCRTAGFEPDVRYTSTDLQIHLRVVEAGLAAALLPGLAGARRHPGVTLWPLRGRPHRRVFTATRVGAGEHPRIATVTHALKDASATAT